MRVLDEGVDNVDHGRCDSNFLQVVGNLISRRK